MVTNSFYGKPTCSCGKLIKEGERQCTKCLLLEDKLKESLFNDKQFIKETIIKTVMLADDMHLDKISKENIDRICYG